MLNRYFFSSYFHSPSHRSNLANPHSAIGYGAHRANRFQIRQVIFVVTLFSGIPAYADPELFDTIHPYVSTTESYSSNLLDLANSAQAVEVLGSSAMSDRWRTNEIGVSFDDQIGLQHVTADLNKSRVDFDRFGLLDYTGTSAKGNWNWAIGTHFTGDLGASYVQAPVSFAYFHELALPLSDLKQQNFDMDWTFHPSWRVVASVKTYLLSYELPVQQADSRNEYHALTGFDYLTPDGSSFGILVGNLRTYFPYPQQFGDDFIVNNNKQKEAKININWNLTGTTSLQYLGGWVERKYDILTQDDYRGWNDRMTLNWNPGGEFSVVGMLWHEIGAVDLLTTVYAVNRGVSVDPVWQVSGKMKLEALYKYEKHDFAQTEQPFGLPEQGEIIDTATTTGALTYDITRHVQFQASAYHVAQSTSNHTSDFHENGLSLKMSFTF